MTSSGSSSAATSALAMGAATVAGAALAARHRFSHNSLQELGRTAPDDPSTQKHVGILAVEVYFPRAYVAQAALEEHVGVPQGKYTIGLGQQGLAVTGDAEDVNSLCLTVVHSLLEK
jgi:alkylation response protein AidB-like acyl-CoA dehydrogenase